MKKIWFACVFTLLLFINESYASDVFSEGDHSTSKRSHFLEYIKDGSFDLHLRSYFMRRDFSQSPEQESMAIGGWFGYRTKSVYGVSLGAVVYTSQGIFFTDEDKDGASLLAPEQKGYTVLGEVYIEGEYKESKIKLFRQKIDSPFLNPFDFRMTPVTFEAYTFETNIIEKTHFYFSHVTKIKDWDDSSFKNMSYAAGFDDSDEPVTMAGFTLTPHRSLTLQLWEYYCHEFMNVVYLQVDKVWKCDKTLTITSSFQAMDQRDIGRAIGGEFHTAFGGVQGIVDWSGWSFTLGFTVTDNTHDTVNPWGSWPGYTSLMEEDNDLAGEKSWVAGITYDFSTLGLTGLIACINHTESWLPEDGSFSSAAQKETDITIDYTCSGILNGVSLRVRYAKVDNSASSYGESYNDFRVIMNYKF